MRWLILATSAIWLACASTPPAPTLFLLRAETPAPSGKLDAPLRIVLERVAVAPYLQTAGIVVETADAQVRAARAYQWAEPLEAGLRSSLRTSISAALGYPLSTSSIAGTHWDSSVIVEIDRLHGSMNGSAVIDASYRIAQRATPGAAAEYRFMQAQPLTSAGYPALVQAERELVAALGAAIAGSLRELGAP